MDNAVNTEFPGFGGDCEQAVPRRPCLGRHGWEEMGGTAEPLTCPPGACNILVQAPAEWGDCTIGRGSEGCGPGVAAAPRPVAPASVLRGQCRVALQLPVDFCVPPSGGKVPPLSPAIVPPEIYLPVGQGLRQPHLLPAALRLCSLLLTRRLSLRGERGKRWVGSTIPRLCISVARPVLDSGGPQPVSPTPAVGGLGVPLGFEHQVERSLPQFPYL